MTKQTQPPVWKEVGWVTQTVDVDIVRDDVESAFNTVAVVLYPTFQAALDAVNAEISQAPSEEDPSGYGITITPDLFWGLDKFHLSYEAAAYPIVLNITRLLNEADLDEWHANRACEEADEDLAEEAE